MWQRLELSDLFYFPTWEAEVHDLLQKHFRELSLIFLAYCRSVLGSDSAEDATEMEMAEFYDFVSECHLETREVNFDRMTIDFVKANAVNSSQARAAHHDVRRSAGTKRDAKAAEVGRVRGANSGEEAVKDEELVLYEFIALLVRISFQRANPTFGNFGNKRQIVLLPTCLQTMLEEEILPRARRDTSAVFRETVMQELSVQAVLQEYEPILKAYYTRVTQVCHLPRSPQTSSFHGRPWPSMAFHGLPSPVRSSTVSRAIPSTLTVRTRWAWSSGCASATSSTSSAVGSATASRTSPATRARAHATSGASQ